MPQGTHQYHVDGHVIANHLGSKGLSDSSEQSGVSDSAMIVDSTTSLERHLWGQFEIVIITGKGIIPLLIHFTRAEMAVQSLDGTVGPFTSLRVIATNQIRSIPTMEPNGDIESTEQTLRKAAKCVQSWNL